MTREEHAQLVEAIKARTDDAKKLALEMAQPLYGKEVDILTVLMACASTMLITAGGGPCDGALKLDEETAAKYAIDVLGTMATLSILGGRVQDFEKTFRKNAN